MAIRCTSTVFGVIVGAARVYREFAGDDMRRSDARIGQNIVQTDAEFRSLECPVEPRHSLRGVTCRHRRFAGGRSTEHAAAARRMASNSAAVG
jgi:hypothetical protein